MITPVLRDGLFLEKNKKDELYGRPRVPVVREFLEIRLSVFEDDKIAICGNRPSARNSPDVHL
jgi:hypothetical protein